MTERLKQLLGDEAGGLDVPPPATNDVIRQGRGLRRRNRLAAGAGAAAVAVIVGGSVVALSGGDGENAAPDPAATISGNAVFSYGNEVFYDGPGHQATIDDTAVKSLFYTSAGVLVRHGDNSYSDGGGPQRFSLVTPDGDVQRLGLETEDTVHASDPDEPYVVYAEGVDGELQVVVYDVTTDSEAARVTVGPTGQHWFPVYLDGDTAYVQNGDGGGLFAVDWRADSVEPADTEPVLGGIAGGHVGTEIAGHPAVVDVSNGDVLVEAEGDGYFTLSPDGRYAMTSAAGGGPGTRVYDVASGSSVTVDGTSYDWGWTADGDLFRVGKNNVTTCDAATGDCTTEPYAQPSIPEPAAVTVTVSAPACPVQLNGECYTDNTFEETCYSSPDECNWDETTYVEQPTIDLKLGGRTYES